MRAGARAGWDCESCRRHGLERKRRCGFLPDEERGEARIVWGRGQVSTEQCPKSMITGESLSLIEEFFVRRRLGIPETMDTDGRKIDAFLILREQVEREERDDTSEY